MGFFSFIGSCISSAVSFVSNAVSAVVDTAKSVVNWIADKATKVWDGVKSAWNVIKKVVKPVLKVVVQLIPFPIVRTAVQFAIKAIELLEKVLDHPVVQKIKKAVEWCLNKAKQLRDLGLTEIERREALERRRLLNKASDNLVGYDQEQKSIYIAKIINEFIILRNEINEYLADNAALMDFDHYLRLRSAHKLLDLTENKLSNQNIEVFEISEDDVFILEIGNQLIGVNPEISDENLARLDRIIWDTSGKTLLPFVFEELLFSWAKRIELDEKEWAAKNKELSKKRVELKAAETKIKYGDSIECDIEALKSSIDSLSSELESITFKINTGLMLNDAAEGFLQILEGNEKVISKKYLMDEGNRVGQLIVSCQEFGRDWQELSTEDRELIIDFANIFREEREKRLQNIPTIMVGAS
jgi:hypothetical protein